MSSNQQKGADSKRLRWAVLVFLGFLPVLALVNWGSPRILFSLFFIGLICLLAAVIDRLSGIRRERLKSLRSARRIRETEKSRESYQAQLKKRDFQSRLRSFTNVDPQSEEETPTSSMEFWQRDSNYFRSHPRPVELLRILLQRISKLVSRQ